MRTHRNNGEVLLKNAVRIFILSFLIFSGLYVTVDADATVVEFMDLPQLTDQADLIFQGRVAAVDARWDDTRKKIWTYVAFRVDEVIKGGFAENEITLRLPGGSIAAENIRLKVDGVPTFEVGDEVVIFCSPDPKRKNPIIGWHQGHFKIRHEKESAQTFISGKRAKHLIDRMHSAASSDTTDSEIPVKKFLEEIVRLKKLQNPTK
jgi:hypothetical protein